MLNTTSSTPSTPHPIPHHPSQLDPREPPPPPASASDPERHHHHQSQPVGIVGLGIGVASPGAGSTTPNVAGHVMNRSASPNRQGQTTTRSRRVSEIGGAHTGGEYDPAVSSPLVQGERRDSHHGDADADDDEAGANRALASKRHAAGGSPFGSPLPSRTTSPAPPQHHNLLNSSMSANTANGNQSRRSSTPIPAGGLADTSSAAGTVNHHRVRDDFIGVISVTPGSRTPSNLGPGSARASFGGSGAGTQQSAHGGTHPASPGALNVDSLKREMKVLQQANLDAQPRSPSHPSFSSSLDPFTGSAQHAHPATILDSDDEYGVKEPPALGSPGGSRLSRSTSPVPVVLDLLPRVGSPGSGSAGLSPLSAGSGSSGELGGGSTRTLGEVGEGFLEEDQQQSREQQHRQHKDSAGMLKSALEKRRSAGHLQQQQPHHPQPISGTQAAQYASLAGLGAIGMSLSTPNSPSASAIFERDIESPFPITLPAASQQGTPTMSPFLSGAAPAPRSPTPRSKEDHHHSASGAIIAPLHMHDTSDRHVPTVLDDAIEALHRSGSASGVQIEAPVNAYAYITAARESGNRSPFAGAAGRSRSPSPSPMKWKDLGRAGGGSNRGSPATSPTRERKDKPRKEEMGNVFSLNDDEGVRSGDREKSSMGSTTRPSMQARQSSLGVFIPGGFPSSSAAAMDESALGAKWRKKIDEWIGPRPDALLAGVDSGDGARTGQRADHQQVEGQKSESEEQKEDKVSHRHLCYGPSI
jgi:hypothetical protein